MAQVLTLMYKGGLISYMLDIIIKIMQSTPHGNGFP